MRLIQRIALTGFVLAFFGLPLAAQTGRREDPKVRIAFNRFYDHAEIGEILHRLESAWPRFMKLASIGKSVEGREMWLMTVNNPETGPEDKKAAIYIDANVHGNEVQGAEVCLYTLWYLMENYGKLDDVTKLVDERVFYVLPSVNPDGRDYWFHQANTSSSSRSGVSPIDSDRDGLLDEDPPNDLDGDGSITQMRKKVEHGGTHKLDPDDDRFLVRVKPGEEGDYILLGSEGIDDDGDGRVNEDGPGGYDMNRSDPSDWQPNYIQFGAGPYPLYWPETRAIANFLLGHPNIAAVQSYHNSGGMILRGPGAASVPEYPRADLAVYDELGRKGERMLPFYRYMIIHKDLYTVHGGFVNFAAEGLGIVSFTNELWASPQAFGGVDRKPDDRKTFNDLIMQGAFYKKWTPYEHPEFGSIEIGGWNKWSSRVPPPFMLEELCHRNMAFTFLHAKSMPKPEWGRTSVTDLGSGVRRIRVEIKNPRLIPTRTALAAAKHIGLPDRLSIEGGAGLRVVAAGFVHGVEPREVIDPVKDDLSLVKLENGIPSRGQVRLEWIVEGDGPYRVIYRAEKGGVLEKTLEP